MFYTKCPEDLVSIRCDMARDIWNRHLPSSILLKGERQAELIVDSLQRLIDLDYFPPYAPGSYGGHLDFSIHFRDEFRHCSPALQTMLTFIEWFYIWSDRTKEESIWLEQLIEKAGLMVYLEPIEIGSKTLGVSIGVIGDFRPDTKTLEKIIDPLGEEVPSEVLLVTASRRYESCNA